MSNFLEDLYQAFVRVCTLIGIEQETNAVIVVNTACDKIEELQKKLAASQARIDQLMLEFCPEEMTQEQMTEWANNQTSVQEE